MKNFAVGLAFIPIGAESRDQAAFSSMAYAQLDQNFSTVTYI